VGWKNLAKLVQSVNTAGTGTGFLAIRKPSLRIYIKVPYIQFLSLQSFVECGFRVRVSSRVRVSVSFIL